MLRVSSELQGQRANLQSLVADQPNDSAVVGGDVLLRFAEAVVAADEPSIEVQRAAVRQQLGDAAMVDAAAVIANFQRMVRIADGTGIPLDDQVLMVTQGIRGELGLNEFRAAANSPQLSFGKRWLGRLIAPLAPRLLKKMARKRAAG